MDIANKILLLDVSRLLFALKINYERFEWASFPFASRALRESPQKIKASRRAQWSMHAKPDHEVVI